MAQSSLRKLGKYEIIEELGKGGFAPVYRARDPHLALCLDGHGDDHEASTGAWRDHEQLEA